MEKRQRQLLKEKLRTLQFELQAKEIVERSIGDVWPLLFQHLLEQGVAFNLVYLARVEAAIHPYVVQAVSTSPLAVFPFPVTAVAPGKPFIHDELYERFPPAYPLRYMPDLEGQAVTGRETSAQILRQAGDWLGITDQPVYFLYNRFYPVITMRFEDLLRHAEMLMDGTDLPEDCCIMPTDFSWLIFRSLEEEWRWGNAPAPGARGTDYLDQVPCCN